MTVRSPEYLAIFPLIQGTLKIAFGIKDAINPFGVLTSEVEDGPAILGPILIPKEILQSLETNMELNSSAVCWPRASCIKTYLIDTRF